MVALEHLIKVVNLGDSRRLEQGYPERPIYICNSFPYVGAALDVRLVKSLLCLSCLSTLVLSRGH
jgi:hypothetical protein